MRKSLLLGAALLIPSLAHGQPVSGPYIAGGVGANWLMNSKVSDYPEEYGETTGTINYSFDAGYGTVLSLGWGFGNGLRLEIEGNYRSNDVTTRRGANGVTGPGAGRATSYGGMVNIFYDFHLLSASLGGITPHVGAGVGYIWHKYDKVGGPGGCFELVDPDGDGYYEFVPVPCPPTPDPSEPARHSGYGSYSGTSGAFAYQLIAGASLPITSVPGLSVTAEYRFLASTGHKVNGKWVEEGHDTVRFKSDADNFNHSVFLGLRYAFNAAPVVAASAVAPLASARTFLVFFDWNKADLTDRARQIIGEAAAGRGQAVTRIEVNGFTDRSGPANSNMRLSQRRAEAVAAELVRRGVPRNEIVTRGFGEANNLVPTADGAREPQNRRVEIILK